MAENFVSRLIFQDEFSETTKKFKHATEEVSSSVQKAGNEVEKASSKVGKLKSALSAIKGKHKTEVKAVGLDTVSHTVSKIEGQIAKLTNKPVTITAAAKLTRNDIKTAKREARELEKQLKDLTGQKYNIDLNVGGQNVQSFGSKLKGGLGTALSVAGGSLLASGIGAATAAAAGGVSSLVSSGNERQQYRTNMEFFLGDEKKAQQMMDWAAKSAAKTQFSSGEVMGATSRAIQISNGDVSNAKRYVQLAQDMASLTPGKSINDAIEALADAQMGEMERLTFSLAA